MRPSEPSFRLGSRCRILVQNYCCRRRSQGLECQPHAVDRIPPKPNCHCQSDPSDETAGFLRDVACLQGAAKRSPERHSPIISDPRTRRLSSLHYAKYPRCRAHGRHSRSEIVATRPPVRIRRLARRSPNVLRRFSSRSNEFRRIARIAGRSARKSGSGQEPRMNRASDNVQRPPRPGTQDPLSRSRLPRGSGASGIRPRQRLAFQRISSRTPWNSPG